MILRAANCGYRRTVSIPIHTQQEYTMQHSSSVRALLAAFVMFFMPWLLHAQQAQIRAIHLAPGASDLDVFVASDTASFYGLGYGNASAVSTLQPGLVRVRVTEHNVPTPVLYDQNIALEANRRKILLVFGTSDAVDVQALNLPTNAPAIPADSAAIRFVQGSPDLSAVDIKIRDAYGNLSTLNGVAFKANTMFKSIAKGAADIEVYDAGTSVRLLKVRHDFAASTRSTLFVTGLATSTAGIRLQVLNEQSLSAQQPIRVVQAPTAGLRAVHIVPGAPAVDIYNGTTLAISNLAYRDASAILSAPNGTYMLGATVTGTPISQALIEMELNLHEDSIYTALAVGDLVGTPPAAMVLARPALMGVSTDSVMIRVVHSAPATGTVNIMVEHGSTLLPLTNMVFRSATPYFTIPAGDIKVMVDEAGFEPFYVATGTIEGGSIVTLFTTGSDNDFGMNMLTDNLTSEQKPMPMLTPVAVAKGGLRAVHVVADAPPVDIFLDNAGDTPLTLAFRQASFATTVNAGTKNVKIAAAGTGIAAALVSRDIEIPSDTLLTAYAVGSVAAGSLEVIMLTTAQDDRPQQGQGQMAVRFLHAAPDAGPVDIELTSAGGQPQRYNGITFKANTPYAIVQAGTATVKVFAAGSQTPLLSVQGALEADANVTAIINGLTILNNLGVNLLTDTKDDEQKPMILLSPTASVRNWNALSAFAIAPNPSHGSTQISYTLPRPGTVRLAIYSQLGELVALSETGARDAGSYTMILSTAMLPAGVYNAVLSGNDGVAIGTEKLVVVK